MAEDRKIHPQSGRDAKVTALSDFEYRVWSQYILSANDLGVMPWTAGALQGGNSVLDARPRKVVEAAMAAILRVGLLRTFVHDGTTYAWSVKWQDWQAIRYPRKSPWPVPDDLSAASEATRELFGAYAQKHGSISETFPKSSGARTEHAREDSGKVSASRAYAPRGGAPNPHPNPHSHPDPDAADAREAAPPAVVLPARARTGRGLTSSHPGCFFAPKACARGLCIPAWLGREWLEQFPDPQEGEATIAAVVADALAKLPPGPVGDEPKAYWRAVWKARHGSVVTNAVTPATAAVRDAASTAAYLDELEQGVRR